MLKKLKYPALFLVVTFFYCREAFFLDRLLMTIGSDSVNSIYSSMAYFKFWIQQGVVPLWNTLSMCGHTFGINSIGVLNLYHLLSIPLSVDAAYNGVVVASQFLNGFFLYLFLIRKGVTRYGAFVGGLIWLLVEGSAVDVGFFSLPLCFFLADRYFEQKSRSRFLLLTLVVFFYSLNANPQYFIYGGLLLFSYGFISEHSRSGSWPRALFFSALPIVLALTVGMFYFTSMFELAAESNRSSWALIQILLPSHFLQAIFPKIFSSPTHPELDFMVPRVLQGFFSSTTHFKNVQSFIDLAYVGLLPLVGILICVMNWAKERRDVGRFFVGSTALTVLYLSFHPFIYQGMVRHLPLLGGMTAVVRVLEVYQFSLVVVGACATDALLTLSVQKREILKKINHFFLIFVILLLIFKVIFGFTMGFFKKELTGRILGGLDALRHPNAFITDVKAFQRQRVEDFFYFFNELFSLKNQHFWIPVGLLSILLAVFFLYQNGRIKPRVFKFFLALFIWLDLGLVLGFTHPSSLRSEVLKDLKIANFIQQDRGIYRVMVLEDKTRSFHRMCFRPESNMIYGIATPDGYEQLYLKRYVKFYELLTKRKGDVGSILHTQEDLEKPLADFLNCKYMVTTVANPKLEGNSAYEKIMDGPEYKVFRNLSVLPRFYTVRHLRTMNGPEEVLKLLKESPEILKDTVLLEGAEQPSLEGSGSGEDDEVKVLSYNPNEIELKIRLKQEGYVVMSESFYPGWMASLDENPAKIERANYAFRAVRVGPGQHHLKMVYRPLSAQIGFWVSMVGLAVLIVVLVFLMC